MFDEPITILPSPFGTQANLDEGREGQAGGDKRKDTLELKSPHRLYIAYTKTAQKKTITIFVGISKHPESGTKWRRPPSGGRIRI